MDRNTSNSASTKPVQIRSPLIIFQATVPQRTTGVATIDGAVSTTDVLRSKRGRQRMPTSYPRTCWRADGEITLRFPVAERCIWR